jgi:AAA family ATP:ADP antiporter
MAELLNRLFRIRPSETGLVLVLGFMLFANSVAMQVSGIVAISNFLSEGGVNQILIVWLVDALLIGLMTGLQSLIIDRFDRVNLTRAMVFGFGLVFIVLRLLFSFRAPGWLNYSLLYLLSDQQWLIFPLVFWILANDIFDMAQTKRLFPLIASLGFVGRILGIGIAGVSPGLFGRLGIESQEMLVLNALIYLLIYLLMQLGLRNVKLRQVTHRQETVRETLSEGWGFVREVPAFRYLTISILALAACDVILEFRFLVISDAIFPDPTSYQRFYTLYRLAFTLFAFAIQSLVSSRIIDKVGLKGAFLILPFTALASATWMTLLPGIASAIGGVLLQKVPQHTVDESARKAFQALVPEERRGRVSIFMDSYLFVVSNVVGILLTGTIIVVGLRLSVPDYFYGYLAVAVLAALVAIWAIFRVRAVYDSSLLNWRLKRRQRGASVLEGLEF